MPCSGLAQEHEQLQCQDGLHADRACMREMPCCGLAGACAAACLVGLTAGSDDL
jgi:hypothetical protein